MILNIVAQQDFEQAVAALVKRRRRYKRRRIARKIERISESPGNTEFLKVRLEQLGDLAEQLVLILDIDPQRECATQQALSDMSVVEDNRLGKELIAECTVAIEHRRVGCDTERLPRFEEIVRELAADAGRVLHPDPLRFR